MRRIIITLLTLSVVATACSSGGQAGVEQGSTGEVAVAAETRATPFAERLYGSVWTTFDRNAIWVQRMPAPDVPAVVPAAVQPGSFSFYGSLAKMQVSVNHPCGSATSAVKITDDRIFPASFTIPPDCAEIGLFTLFAEAEIEAAFRDQHLELTTEPVSFRAYHYVSVSDNGIAPLFEPGDAYRYDAQWTRSSPASASDDETDRFVVRALRGSHGCSGAVESYSVNYGTNEIRIAISVIVESAANIRIPCGSLGNIVIELREPPAGRPIVPWIRPTTVVD